MAVLADSIDGNGIYAMRAEADKDGNRIDLTYAKLTDIPTATSDLQNDSGFITSADIPVTDVEVDGVSVVSGGVASITMPSVPVTDVEVDGVSVVSGGVASITLPNVPVTDVTVNGTSVVSNGTAAVTVPTATSDLTNDSGFITSSDIPAQVQADWTQSNSAEPSYIAHKPTLAAVAVSGDYSDLSNKPTINNVPAVTSSDDNKVLKASYTGGVGSYSWENETGTTYSAGTGIDIDQNNAISVENPLPSSTSADEGKVLKVDANGDPEWATGGGGSQVQSNWLEDDTTDPSYIENKPTPKTLVAGQGIAISESSASLTVTNTVARDAVNLVAGSGVTLTQSGSDLTISSVVPTVDLVGGPGITVDNPDGNTVRISVNQPARETLLYYSDAGAPGDTQRTYALSESPMNFERIGVFMFRPVSGNWMGYTEFDTAYMQSVNKTSLTVPMAFINNSDHFLGVYGVSGILTSSWADVQGGQMVIGSSYSKGYFAHIYKIIGINRIAGGN